MADGYTDSQRNQTVEPQCLRYFHPRLTSIDDVKRVMHPFITRNGHYILRISTTQEKTYTVSVVHSNGIKHFKVLRVGSQYYLQDHIFNTIYDLVKFYSTNSVPNMERVQNVLLLYPIINEEREDGQPSLSSPSSSSSLSHASSTRGSFSSDGSVFAEEVHKLPPSRRDLPPPPDLPRAQSNPRRSESQRQPTKTPIPLQPRRNSENLDQRPPVPIPQGSTDYNGVYYSRVKPQQNQLEDLVKTLSMSSLEDTTHCECGLDLELSQLPLGWTVHISKEESSFGRPFFMSSAQVTSWALPQEVYLEINNHQQKFLKFLCENYEQGNDPPDKDTQLQFSSTSSSTSSIGVARTNSSFAAASCGNRDSTGSNTGASSQPQFTSRGPKDTVEAGAAAGAIT